MKITYSSNNSGGGWWLSDENWHELAANGWEVRWYAEQEGRILGDGPRFLGGLASEASKEFDSIDDAVSEWESVTGQRAADLGCQCCGPPHEFYSDDYSESFDGHDVDDEEYW